MVMQNKNYLILEKCKIKNSQELKKLNTDIHIYIMPIIFKSSNFFYNFKIFYISKKPIF